MKSYIFKDTTNYKFSKYHDCPCTVEFFRDDYYNLLKVRIVFSDEKWITTSPLIKAPKHDGDKMEIHTLHSIYYFKEVKEKITK